MIGSLAQIHEHARHAGQHLVFGKVPEWLGGPHCRKPRFVRMADPVVGALASGELEVR